MIRRTAMLSSLALLMLASIMPSTARSAMMTDAYAAGTRSGPFVATDRSLSDLAADGYEVKTSYGRALILQKEGSIFSCEIPPAREELSYEPYFVCSELKEEKPGADQARQPKKD